MKRWQADFLLGLTGLIWGFGFVAQKDAFAHLGPFTFVACRFLVSALFVLPFVLREGGFRRVVSVGKGGTEKTVALCAAFAAAVTAQQYGMQATSVTNSAFLTGLYIIIAPFVGLVLYRHKLSSAVFLASVLALLGVGLLTGASVTHFLSGFTYGDALMLLCAVCFAFQVVLMGHLVGASRMPFRLSFLQYISAGFVALLFAVRFETIDLSAIASAGWPILYAGVLSGGVAYTLQAIAQQHTPSADTAIITGAGETLFGAIGGAWLLHETMGFSGYMGCLAILAAILLVEIVPFLKTKKS